MVLDTLVTCMKDVSGLYKCHDRSTAQKLVDKLILFFNDVKETEKQWPLNA